MKQATYSTSQKALHWVSVILIGIMAFTGLAYVYEWADESIIIGHQIAGQVLIVVLLSRIAARVRKGGRVRDQHALWERVLSSTVHIGLYAAMIAFVVTGYVAASALRDNVLLIPLDIGFARSDLGETFLETHYALKWVLAGLLFLHIAGAIKHVLIDRDETFSSIWPSKREDIS